LIPGKADELTMPEANVPVTLSDRIATRADHLRAYQGGRLAKRYLKRLETITDPAMKEAVAKGYHKLLAYKDEYEVARLLTQTRAKAEAAFDGDLKISYHMAPPMLSRVGADGRPIKKTYGAMMERLFPLLACLKGLRGTPFDPFGYSAERRMERRLIRQYERDLKTLAAKPDQNPEAAIALAELPLDIRGFGPVKHANAEAAAKRRDDILDAWNAGSAPERAAAE
jgi:indolepyruvate ferredoxin oxidoreductase